MVQVWDKYYIICPLMAMSIYKNDAGIQITEKKEKAGRKTGWP